MRTIRKKPMAIAIAYAIAGCGHAAAQAPQDDVTQVVVTGTSIRGVDPVGSQAVHLDAKDIAATGLTSVAEVAKTLPQLQGLGFGEAPVSGQNGGGNLQRGSTLNLRGIGSGATLLLVDGHRLAPTGTVVNFTEANVVPVSALERIEVVADGASAVYGSDAVAGVVNYVLRRDFDGVDIAVRGTTSRYWNQRGANVLAGRTWASLGGMGKGNVLVSADIDKHDPFVQGRSPYLRQDVTRFGGNDARLQGNTITGGDRANIAVPGFAPNLALPNAGTYTYYTVAPGSTGTPAAAQLLLNQPSIADSSDYADYLAAVRRKQLAVLANQVLNDRLRFGFQGFYTDRTSDLRSAFQANGFNGLTVSPASPFYIAGIPGVPPGMPLAVQYNFFKDMGYQVQRSTDRNLSLTGELEARLGQGWRATLSHTYGRDKACGVCIPTWNFNAAGAVAAIDAGVFNPFDTSPVSSRALSMMFGDNLQMSRSTLNDTVLKANGPLAATPAGAVRAAVGAEYTNSDMYLENGANRNADNNYVTDVKTLLSRRIDSYFAELFVPLVGEDMAVPLMQKLALDAAVRTERYSDFGRTTNPKLGVEWTVNDDVRLRGSWGKSFRAPTLADLNPMVFSARIAQPVPNSSGDPALPVDIPGANLTNVLVYGGSNAALRPETAKTWSLGLDVNPSALPGLHLSATYFNIDYTNQIIGLFSQYSQFLASSANRQLFAPFIFPTPAPANCRNGDPASWNPTLTAYLKIPALFGNLPSGASPANACGIRAVLDARNQNVGSTRQDGIDLAAGYDLDAGPSHWAFGGTVSYLLHVRMKTVPSAAEVDRVDTINNPVRLRSRVSASWTQGPASANVFVNHVGAYRNNLPVAVMGVQQPEARVSSWTTVDAGFAYAFAQKDGLLAGVRLSVNAQNLLNRKPPIVISTNGLAIDNQNANPYGTVATVQLAKKF